MSQVLLNNVLMNNNEKIKESMKNLLKLFQRRGYFNTSNEDKIDKMTNDIKINGKTNLSIGDVKISVYYKDIDLKNISSGSEVDEFLSKNTEFIKFVMLKEFSKKVYKQVNDYKNSYIFHIFEMLEDIPSKNIVPEHQLLSDSDKEELKKVYDISFFPKINNTDMMSRYYGAKVGDIFRIKRLNLNSGISTYYRRVIKDSNISFL
jgi:DNA-directed RNA polymerase subunit H (RpoH/RPB5)